MKCQIPQISWHSRDPVLSIDFQPYDGNKLRLASGGTDSHVLIWYITYQENKSINIECASDLYRHNKSVNAVRFSPNGDLLASGDDEGALFLWQLKERDATEAPKDEDDGNQENWYPLKLLRGHLEDIYDISWSADGNFLVSASMDNTAIVWDMQKFQKVHIFSESKGYVQGVAWDPLNVYIATIGTDRALRILNINSKKTAFKVQRAPWSVTTERGTFRARLFHDDTLKSYFRRLCFTPDGELLIVPSGIMEKDDKSGNTTYIFSRHAPNKPVAYLPTGDKYTVAVRCSPLLYKLRRSEDKENQHTKSLINLPYRIVFAVAACDSVVIYDTEQLVPIAYISNIHYTHLTDLTWSADGRILVGSSTDGYCSFIIFNDEELGEVYELPPPESPKKEVQNDVTETVVDKPLENETVVPSSETLTSVTEKKSATLSPIEAKSPNVLKPKKPKLTIKNFFASPKVEPAATVTKSDGNVSTPVSTPKANEPDDIEKKVEIVPMELQDNACNDSCSIELLCEVGKSKSSTPVKKSPKCKLQLNFADKITPIDAHPKLDPNLNEANAVILVDEPLQEISVKVENENDWKLELSQDEDIMPMDSLEPSSKDITPMDVSEPSTSATELKIPSPQTTPKPKRRINFITLSTKVSMTPPKE